MRFCALMAEFSDCDRGRIAREPEMFASVQMGRVSIRKGAVEGCPEEETGPLKGGEKAWKRGESRESCGGRRGLSSRARPLVGKAPRQGSEPV